jgi:hypothetical protein
LLANYPRPTDLFHPARTVRDNPVPRYELDRDIPLITNGHMVGKEEVAMIDRGALGNILGVYRDTNSTGYSFGHRTSHQSIKINPSKK